MRKTIVLGSILCIMAIIVFACEKDDICEPGIPTTPRMIVKFHNIDNPSTTKATVNLSLFGKDSDDPLLVNNSQFINDTIARIPLRINEDITTYRLVMNADNETLQKSDTIQFSYARNDFYISRACGFKTLFNLFGHSTERPFLLNNSLDITGNWIKKIEILQPNINDENETHIIIYH